MNLAIFSIAWNNVGFSIWLWSSHALTRLLMQTWKFCKIEWSDIVLALVKVLIFISFLAPQIFLGLLQAWYRCCKNGYKSCISWMVILFKADYESLTSFHSELLFLSPTCQQWSPILCLHHLQSLNLELRQEKLVPRQKLLCLLLQERCQSFFFLQKYSFNNQEQMKWW